MTLTWRGRNFLFRHLMDPTRPFTISALSIQTGQAFPRNELAVVYKGPVGILYLADETRQGVTCRKYTIDGPGLDRGGFLG